MSETGTGAPLVILHGLFGSKRNWSSIAGTLARHHRVITADMRNHGESPWDALHDYPALAEDVAQLIETRVGAPAVVMGHSMGGKAAMMLAVTRPELVERLVVVDIAPARSISSPLLLVKAMRRVPLETLSRRAEVDAVLAEVIPDLTVRGFLAQNVVTEPTGLRWSVNLDAIERNGESIVGFPDIPPGVTFTKPTLFIAGGRSEYLRPEHRDRIERLFPVATIEIIPNAGHWVHAEAPGPFLEVVSRFLA
jgi:pimeloyl-ACP methyl ester carboxylesterase